MTLMKKLLGTSSRASNSPSRASSPGDQKYALQIDKVLEQQMVFIQIVESVPYVFVVWHSHL
jgi:hypothetical protein